MRILFLTHRLPYAPNRGDRIRAYYLLREMSQLGDVTLFSLVHDDDEDGQGRGASHSRGQLPSHAFRGHAISFVGRCRCHRARR